MFRSFIYLDEDKMYSYKRQISPNNGESPKKKRTTSLAVNAGTKALGVSAKNETETETEISADSAYDYDQFEAALSELEGDDYFDTVMNPDHDLTTVPPMKIIRICSRISIPEEFDLVNAIHPFLPFFVGQVETESKEENELLHSVFDKAVADIPFLADDCDIAVAGKLAKKNLLEDLSSFEDYEGQEVYLLCKVVGLSRKDEVEIFDPLKDFVRLPRAIRRQMESNGRTEGLEKIKIPGPVLKVEVIAIYK